VEDEIKELTAKIDCEKFELDNIQYDVKLEDEF